MSIQLSYNVANREKLNKSKPRIHGPDILRGLSALSVIFFHVIYITGVPYSDIYMWITGRFDFFVRIFYMISAFSMAYVYIDHINTIDDIKNSISICIPTVTKNSAKNKSLKGIKSAST